MMPGFNISFRIIEDTFTPALQQLVALLPGEMTAAAEASLEDGKTLSEEVCPVLTGYLRSRIQTQMTGPLEGELFDDAGYAFFVEEGTWKMAPEPFLRPGLERTLQVLPGYLLQALMNAARGD